MTKSSADASASADDTDIVRASVMKQRTWCLRRIINLVKFLLNYRSERSILSLFGLRENGDLWTTSLLRYRYIFFICIFTFFFTPFFRVSFGLTSRPILIGLVITLLRVFDNILCSFMWMIITIATLRVMVTVTVTVAVWSLTFRFGSTTSRVYTTSCLLHNYDFTIGIFLSRSTFHWTTNSSIINKVGCDSFCN